MWPFFGPIHKWCFLCVFGSLPHRKKNEFWVFETLTSLLNLYLKEEKFTVGTEMFHGFVSSITDQLSGLQFHFALLLHSRQNTKCVVLLLTPPLLYSGTNSTENGDVG